MGAFRAGVVACAPKPATGPAGLRFLLFLALMMAPPPAHSQSLAPGNPSKEYIYAGDRLVAILNHANADFALTATPASGSRSRRPESRFRPIRRRCSCDG